MLHLSTFFDKNYLSRGLVLYNSLDKVCKNFTLYVLCLDDFTANYFKVNASKFTNVITISLTDLEEFDNLLFECKQNRTKIEYYFTLSPCLPLYLIHKFKLNHICTLDADILFLHDVQPIFDQLDNYSIIITPHKFSKSIISSEKFGKFNVSFQIFKNDEIGLSCLNRWRQQCIDWCCDYYDEVNQRFADQKYLDNWPALYGNRLLVLNDPVCGIAAWNINNYAITCYNNEFYSNQQKIVFYHFHNFKILGKNWAANGFDKYNVLPNNNIHHLYLYYWNLLVQSNKLLGNVQDVSARVNLSGNLGNKLNNERFVYFKLFSTKIFYLDYLKLPEFLRKVIYKING